MLSWTIIWKVWNRQENSGNSTRFSPLARFYLHLPLFAPMILTTLPTSFSTPKQAYSISSLPKKWIASWKRHAQKGDRKYEPNSIRKWSGFLFRKPGNCYDVADMPARSDYAAETTMHPSVQSELSEKLSHCRRTSVISYPPVRRQNHRQVITNRRSTTKSASAIVGFYF